MLTVWNTGLKLLKRFSTSSCKDEDLARKQYIFNVLIISLIFLVFTAFIISTARHLLQGGSFNNTNPQTFVLLALILLILLELSHRQFSKWAIYSFVALYFALGTYSLHLYSYILPHGLLLYALVIVISGILISARAALIITLLVFTSLSLLAYIQSRRITVPYTTELNDPIRMNLAVYLVMFLIIFLVSWLSNREIEKSLARARKSEKMLRRERNLLEVKVQQRTRELEQAQTEKMNEIYKFAEFGRISSSILHDLANPLTAVSLNLNLLEDKDRTGYMGQIRQGISHIEQYVESARQQLRKQSEHREFDSKIEIEKVISFLHSKAQSNQIKIEQRLISGIKIYGDSVKFSQIISNLVGNSIDACEHMRSPSRRKIAVCSSVSKDARMLIIEVKDRGEGIEKIKIPHIFESFYTTKSDRGTGIGLTITRRIIQEDFKGNISVKSSKRKTAQAFL